MKNLIYNTLSNKNIDFKGDIYYLVDSYIEHFKDNNIIWYDNENSSFNM